MKEVAIIGLWHQGVVGAACMADYGYDVIAADHNQDRINKLKVGKAPLFEPGLNELICKGIDTRRLDFTSDVEKVVIGKKNIMIMYDTPVNDDDQSDLTELYNTIDEISKNLENDVIIYITSQIPVGTCNKIVDKIKENNPKLKFGIAYSPENLRLGNAIELFKNPVLPVIGAESEYIFDRVKTLLSPMKVDWEHVNLNTSEMTKHALNTYLALSITFGNELGNLCDEVGADGHRMAEVLKMEPRIGTKAMLSPGLGFSGATLARDIQTLRGLFDQFNLDSLLLDGLIKANDNQNKLVLRKLRKIFGSVKGLRIAVMGLTYKPNTSTLRRSAALEIINDIIQEGASVSCHDPKADRDELKNYTDFKFFDDPYKTVVNASALVLITPWDDYKNLDFERIRKKMTENAVIVDTSNLWDGDYLEGLGFMYFDIGKGRNVKGKI